MTLSDAEIAALVPILRAIAGRLGRRFPAWRMSNADLVQTAFLGILKIIPRAEETADDLLKRRLRAGQNRMIDGIRAFHDNRPGHCRRMEILMPDVLHLIDNSLTAEGPEDILLREYDGQRRTECLSPRERFLLQQRLQGATLVDVGKCFGVNESRACQIEKEMVTKLQEAA